MSQYLEGAKLVKTLALVDTRAASETCFPILRDGHGNLWLEKKPMDKMDAVNRCMRIG